MVLKFSKGVAEMTPEVTSKCTNCLIIIKNEHKRAKNKHLVVLLLQVVDHLLFGNEMCGFID